jgi:hypothetical protein
MKTPREILLRHHQAAVPKLDAIRAKVVEGIATPGMSWLEWIRSLRWHLAALSAAWVVVMILNMDHSPSAVAMIPPDKMPSAQQVWAALRENRRLLLEYTETPAEETPAAPTRRSEMEPEQVVV